MSSFVLGCLCLSNDFGKLYLKEMIVNVGTVARFSSTCYHYETTSVSYLDLAFGSFSLGSGISHENENHFWMHIQWGNFLNKRSLYNFWTVIWICDIAAEMTMSSLCETTRWAMMNILTWSIILEYNKNRGQFILLHCQMQYLLQRKTSHEGFEGSRSGEGNGSQSEMLILSKVSII